MCPFAPIAGGGCTLIQWPSQVTESGPVRIPAPMIETWKVVLCDGPSRCEGTTNGAEPAAGHGDVGGDAVDGEVVAAEAAGDEGDGAAAGEGVEDEAGR